MLFLSIRTLIKNRDSSRLSQTTKNLQAMHVTFLSVAKAMGHWPAVLVAAATPNPRLPSYMLYLGSWRGPEQTWQKNQRED